MKKTPIATAISIALAQGSLLFGGLAMAQEQNNEDALTDEELMAIEDDTIEEVVTTGSRIKKDAFSTSAPMSIIDVEQASVQGIANVGELLQNMSTAAGSPQITSAIATEGNVNGGLGTNTISLRGLGANRTLVLLNGRRAGPSGVRGGVSSFDMGVLPLATIERVEVLKDGASSIYGSDAVAGVVNIITKREDGGTIDGFTSMPSESGGEQSRISASWGKTFDRGGFRVTADYNKVSELQRGERDFFECGNEFVFDPDTGERRDIVDPRTGNFRCSDLTWGHIWIYDYGASNIPGGNLAQFDFDNDLGSFTPGYGAVTSADDLTTPAGWFPVSYDRASRAVTNSDHPFQDGQSLIPETETTTFYAEGDFDVTDSITMYGEVLLNRRTTYQNDYRQYWSYKYSGDWDFSGSGAGFGDQLSADAGWFGAQWFSPTAITDHADDETEVDYQRFVAGLRGEFQNGWEWDATYSASFSDGEYWSQEIFDDAIRDQNFATGSCVGQTTSVGGAPCVDVRWLSEDVMNGNLTAEERAYLFGTQTGTTEYNQWSIDAYVTGEAYELPAGPLSFAVGLHYREDEIEDTPGVITLANNAWGATGAGITKGDDHTNAVFVELDVPLINDAPAVRDLTLNTSARYTDVDSFGSDTTWKAGLNWQITDSVRVRANQGTSFRTPALFELFLANQTSFGSTRIDPCIRYGQELSDGNISQTVADNCAADPAGLAADYTGGTISPTIITGGGFGVLSAETSETTSIGVIWQPAFADLSISIDYFDIKIENEVDQLGATRIVAECYESEDGFAFGGNEPLCNLFDRSLPNSGIDNIRDSFINIAEQTNRGIDFNVRYNHDLQGWGQLRVDLEANRQIEDERALFADDVDDLNDLPGDPVWVGNWTFALDRGPLIVTYNGRYVGGASADRFFPDDIATLFGEEVRVVRAVDSVVYHALSASYDFEGTGIRALVGVANLTDEEPPQLSNISQGGRLDTVGNAAFYSQYDWLGRRFFANLTYEFE